MRLVYLQVFAAALAVSFAAIAQEIETTPGAELAIPRPSSGGGSGSSTTGPWQPLKTFYRRPHIQRVWLPAAGSRNATAYRANYTEHIRNFAYAIKDTDRFLRYLEEEEAKLGLRTQQKERVKETRGKAQSRDSTEMPDSEYEDSLSVDRKSTAVSVTPAEAPHAKGQRRHSKGVPPPLQSLAPPPPPPTVHPDALRWLQAAAATPAPAPAPALRSGASHTPAAPNRTTPYTVTPVASFYDPNNTFAYETYANRYVNSRVVSTHLNVLPVNLSDPAGVTAAPNVYRDASDSKAGNVSSLSLDTSEESYFSTSSEEDETEEQATLSAHNEYPANYRSLLPYNSGHPQTDNMSGNKEDRNTVLVNYNKEGTESKFKNRPLVPFSAAASKIHLTPETNVQESNNTRHYDSMTMSPSTVSPFLEPYSRPQINYQVSLTTIQNRDKHFLNNTTNYANTREHMRFSNGFSSTYQNDADLKESKFKSPSRTQSLAFGGGASFNPFSNFPKYRATYVPRREQSVKVLATNDTLPPHASVIAYIEEPYAALQQSRALAASRGASGNIAPQQRSPPSSSPPSPPAAGDTSPVPATTAAYAVPYFGDTHFLPGRRRKPAAGAARRRPRKQRRYGPTRAPAGTLLPPLVGRRGARAEDDLERLYAVEARRYGPPYSRHGGRGSAAAATALPAQHMQPPEPAAASAAAATSGHGLLALSSAEAALYRRKEKVSLGGLAGGGATGEHGSIPGVPGRDYPTYSKPPVRNFSCLDLKVKRGYVADPSTRCQVFYICPGDGRGKAMLCPNGTVFNQEVSVCDWWFNVKCASAEP